MFLNLSTTRGTSQELIEGLTKFQATMNLIPTITFATTKAPPTTFTTPKVNGDYTIIAKSGLSFDGSKENAQAFSKNIDIWIGNMIGMFSTKLKALYRLKFGACGGEIASLVINSTRMFEDFKKYSEKKSTNYEFIKSFVGFSVTKYGDIIGIINRCSGQNKIKAKSFLSILNVLDLLNRLESAYNGSAHLTDWVQYDKEIKMCFNKNGSEVNKCNPIIGSWKETSHIYCGLDVYLIPSGQSQFSTNCNSQIFGFTNCQRDDLWVFNVSNTGFIDEGPTKCSANDPQTNPFNYILNSNQTITISSTNGGSEIYEILTLNSTTMTLKIPGDTYSTIISTFKRQ